MKALGTPSAVEFGTSIKGARGPARGYAREKAVALVGRGAEVLGDEHGYHEAVDRQDTGHDDGDEGLEWSQSAVFREQSPCPTRFKVDPTFMTRSGLNWPIPAMAIPDLTVPYAAPRAEGSC